MIKSTVEPECTGQFSPVFIDYIRQQEKLGSFYRYFPTLSNFQKIVQERKMEADKRGMLVKALEKQYETVYLTEKVTENLQALKSEKTFTVTTGHQLNLFTGPLYFIYKIVSTINLAKKLKEKYPDYHFVPVYWMATEDHDFEEINHFTYEGTTYRWETDQKGAVGDFVPDENLKQLIKELSFVPDFFKKAYLDSPNMAVAARRYVHHLFGEEGLIIVDGNDKLLKKMFAPIMAKDLVSNKSNDLVNEQTRKLEDLGYKSQIYPREINFFYMDKGLRSRIVKKGERYKVIDTELSFAEDELLEMVDEQPERFSPNVVMRPVYQEVILPNIAYLGGPAEVAYWLQLRPVFDHYQIDFPIIMPRNFALILDVKVQRKAKSLGLEQEDYFRKYGDWKKEFVKKHAALDLGLEQEKKQLSAIFEALGENAAKIDPTLNPSSASAKVRALKVLDHFGGKLRKAEERNMETSLRQMREIKEVLFPGGVAQERKNNFLPYFLENPTFIAELFRHFDPLNFDFVLLAQDGPKGNTQESIQT